MNAELIPKYEEWVQRLEVNLEGLVRERRTMGRALVVAVVLSPFGFFFSKWLVLSIFGFGVLLYGTTIYITEMRKYQYTAELEKTKAELLRLRMP